MTTALALLLITGATGAYLLLGTFCHWVILKVDENWDAVNYELPRDMAGGDGAGKLIFAIGSFFIVPICIFYGIVTAVTSGVKGCDADPFSWYDALWKRITKTF